MGSFRLYQRYFSWLVLSESHAQSGFRQCSNISGVGIIPLTPLSAVAVPGCQKEATSFCSYRHLKILAIVGFHLIHTMEEQAAWKNRFVSSIGELQFCLFFWELLTHCSCSSCQKRMSALVLAFAGPLHQKSREMWGIANLAFPVEWS